MARKNDGRNSMFGVMEVVVAVVILLVIIRVIAGQLGIIKATYISVDNREDKASIPATQITDTLVSTTGSHKYYSAVYDEETGTWTHKVPAGTYELWMDWDGIYYSDGMEVELNTFITQQTELIGDPAVFRCLILEFYDVEENKISPSSLSVTDETGEEQEYSFLTDGLYMIFLDDSVADYTVTLTADDYQPVTCTVDMTQSRAIKLVVMFQ